MPGAPPSGAGAGCSGSWPPRSSWLRSCSAASSTRSTWRLAGIGDDANASPQVATGETDRSTVAQGASHRDEIAAEPMLTVPESAAFPAEAASQRGARRSRSRPGPGRPDPGS